MKNFIKVLVVLILIGGLAFGVYRFVSEINKVTLPA